MAENTSFAQFDIHPDLKAIFNARTYPIGAQGYVRADFNLMTSAVVNRAGLNSSPVAPSIQY